MVNAENISSSPIGSPWWSAALDGWNDPFNPFVLANNNSNATVLDLGSVTNPIVVNSSPTNSPTPMKRILPEPSALGNLIERNNTLPALIKSKLLLNKHD